MKLVSIKPSKREQKKLVATFSDGKQINFGQKDSKTYVNGASDTTRKAYIARHKVNEDWDKVNPASLSRFILWGNSKNLNDNIQAFKRKFKL